MSSIPQHPQRTVVSIQGIDVVAAVVVRLGKCCDVHGEDVEALGAAEAVVVRRLKNLW